DGGVTQEGPLHAAEVLAWLADGRIAGDHLARSETTPWAPVGAQLDALREVPKAPPPLPSVALLRAPPPPPLPKRPEPAPRKPRDDRQHRKAGAYDREQFERCWNGLDATGLDRRDLIFFACALLRPGTFAQLFGSANPPVEHLAVFPNDVVILTAPPTGDVQARRLPLASLTWAFAPKADVRGFADSARDDLAEAVKVTLAAASAAETLYLRPGSATDKLTELLPELAVARAREEFGRGRGVPAEDYLKKVPDAARARQAADLLRTEIGTLAMVTVDHRQGLPGVAAGVRGRLRLDRRMLEFFDDVGQRSVPVALDQVRRVLKVQAGEEPAEYVQQVQAQQGANALVGGLAFVDPFLYFGAKAVMAGSAGGRPGQALGNRLILVVTTEGREVPVIVDVAGPDRGAIVRAATEFQLHLETLLGSRGQPAAPSIVRVGWEPHGIRDRLSTLRDAGHLAGEDYGFLMTI